MSSLNRELKNGELKNGELIKSELINALGDLLSLSQHLHPETLATIDKQPQFWQHLIRLGSEHMLLSALFPALQQKLPDALEDDKELHDYLEAAFELNVHRNETIRQQAISIAKVLNSCGIEVIFLKGTAYLFDSPPSSMESHWKTRAIGDIDILVDTEQLYEAIAALQEFGYNSAEGRWYYPHTQIHHYAPLHHPEAIALLEVHEHAVHRHLTPRLTFNEIRANAIAVQNDEYSLLLPSANFRIAHCILHAQIGESGFYSGRLPMKQLYDFSLLATQTNISWQTVTEYFQGPVKNEMLHSFLHQAVAFLDWKLPRELSPIRSYTQQLRSLVPKNFVDFSLAALGSLSRERIMQRNCATQNALQLLGFRCKRVFSLIKKFIHRGGRRQLLSFAQEGVSGTSVSTAAQEKRISEFALLTVEGQQLLLHRKSGTSFLLNSSAGMIAEDLLAGTSVEAIASEISQQASLPIERARKDVEVVETLLLGEYQPPNDALLQQTSTPFESHSQESATVFLRPNLQLTIEFPRELSEHISTSISLLRTLTDYAKQNHARNEATDSSSKSAHMRRIAIVNHESYFRIFADDGYFYNAANESVIPSLLYAQMQRIFGSHVEHSVALHGGAFSDTRGAFLLLGVSGSGKTTLLSALENAKKQILSDDLLLLNESGNQVCRLPFPFGIKQGSWDTLGVSDGEKQRFQHPNGEQICFRPVAQLPENAFPTNGASEKTSEDKLFVGPIRACIFPHYSASSEFSIESLSPAEALCEISTAGFLAPSTDYLNSYQCLILTLETTPSYRCSYRSLEPVIQWLNDLD